VTREFTKNDATDFKAILTKIKGRKPDAVFYGGMDAQAGPMAKQMKQLASRPSFFGRRGLHAGVHQARRRCDRWLLLFPGRTALDRMADKGSPNGSRSVFNAEVQIYSPYSYDAVAVLVDAMKRANSADPAKYIAELPKASTPASRAGSNSTTRATSSMAHHMYDAKDGKLNVLDVVAAKPRQRACAEAAPANAGKAAEAPKAAEAQRPRLRKARQRRIEAGLTRRNGTSGCRSSFWRGTYSRQPVFPGYHSAVPSRACRGFRHPPAADHQRLVLRQRVRAGGAGLHDGLRRARPHQFRARRGGYDRCLSALTAGGILQRLLPGCPAGAAAACDARRDSGVHGAGLRDRTRGLPAAALRAALAPLITAIGVSILLQNIAMVAWDAVTTAFRHMCHGSLSRIRRDMTPVQVVIIVVAAAIMAGLMFLVHRTRLGRAMRATAENQSIAG